ncbi:MAG: glutathione S-transferase [Pseudomonadota bacterium]
MSGDSINEPSQGLSIGKCVNTHCPWSGNPVSADSLTLYRERVVGFCNPGCRDKFASAISHFEDCRITS